MAAILAIGIWPAAGRALVIEGNQVIVGYGVEQQPHARVVFSKDRAARQGVSVETFRAGVAGSKLTILVDNKVLLSRVFTATDCAPRNGIDHCMISINGRDQMSARLRDQFRRGLISRLQLETGGVMSMSYDVPLQGFDRAITNGK